MIMEWRDSEGRPNFVFCNDGRVVNEKVTDREVDGSNVEDASGYETSGVPLA
jgi:hypothetical protein